MWGIWVRRSGRTSPFLPLYLSTHLPLPFLRCPSGPSRGLQPRQPTDYIAMSTQTPAWLLCFKGIYAPVWKRHSCFSITCSTQSLLAVILDSLLNQQSVNAGLLGPFRPVFKWKGQTQRRASVFKARCQPSVDLLHGTLTVIWHTFLEGITLPGGRKRELSSGLIITLWRCKSDQCIATALLRCCGGMINTIITLRKMWHRNLHFFEEVLY